MKFFSYSRSKNEQLAFDDRIHWLNKKKENSELLLCFFGLEDTVLRGLIY